MGGDPGRCRPDQPAPQAPTSAAEPAPPSGPPQGLQVSPEDWQRTPPSVRALLVRVLAEWTEAQEQLAALRRRLEELEERLRTDSHNSSKPPSSDPPSSPGARGPNGKPRGERKPGGQPGHEGRGRPLVPPEKLAQAVDCPPPSRCSCGGAVEPTPGEPQRHQVWDLPPHTPHVTEYRLWPGACAQCGQTCLGSLPPGVPTGLLGPRAMAIIALFSGKFHLSKRHIEELLEDLFGLPLGLGTISNTEARVEAALAKPVEEAKAFVQAQPVVHMDETGWRQGGQKRWMWTALTAAVAVFAIRASRGACVAVELLGTAFRGFLVSDRWSAYAWLDAARRQFCWAHLQRDFTRIAERAGASAAIGTGLLDATRAIFGFWHHFRDGPLSRAALQEALWPLRQQVEALLDEGTRCGHAKTQRTCQRILKLAAALWTFADVPGVEPTNNAAERAIRPAVWWRQASFGTQSERGNRFVESLLTVTATCRLQARNVLDYLVQAIEAHLSGLPSPSLIPTSLARH
jgi:transposase